MLELLVAEAVGLVGGDAEPLAAEERRELDRLKGTSKHVRELLAVLERGGQEPVRYDLRRCRNLARLESLLDGQA